MTGKVVGIDGGKKTDEFCGFCGKTPACPEWTCPRVKAYKQDGDGTVVYVEFFPPEVWNPRA